MMLDCDQEQLDEEFFESIEKKIPTLELIQIREETDDELWVGIGKKEDHS